ncbi:MAG: hypothetical protein U5R31_01570 [Acidimicrobiia bacterium]|nr:hypothetical protein [Acidimicrobiia bacterium]
MAAFATALATTGIALDTVVSQVDQPALFQARQLQALSLGWRLASSCASPSRSR